MAGRQLTMQLARELTAKALVFPQPAYAFGTATHACVCLLLINMAMSMLLDNLQVHFLNLPLI